LDIIDISTINIIYPLNINDIARGTWIMKIDDKNL
jgi:hypothetical protein